MSLTTTLLALAVPLLLGVLSGAVRLFPAPDAAIEALNRFVLYLAFPILIVVGTADSTFVLPKQPAFYLIVPAVAAVLTLILAAARKLPSMGDKVGAVALTSLFANTAYVGLPVIEGVLGPQALGLGALAVAIHVTTAMIVGPTLLLTWSGRSEGALLAAFSKVVRQPLAWAPVIGLCLRFAPPAALEAVTPMIAPIGRTASPVGLFLIGLFLHTHGRRLQPGTGLALQLLSKLLVVPLITLAFTTLAVGAGQLEPREGAVLVLLSSMPTAISTFSLAVEFDTAVEQVTVAIVASTALSAIAIPIIATWAI